MINLTLHYYGSEIIYNIRYARFKVLTAYNFIFLELFPKFTDVASRGAELSCNNVKYVRENALNFNFFCLPFSVPYCCCSDLHHIYICCFTKCSEFFSVFWSKKCFKDERSLGNTVKSQYNKLKNYTCNIEILLQWKAIKLKESTFLLDKCHITCL